MKKITAFLLAAVMLLALTACHVSSSSTTTVSTSVTDENGQTTTTETTTTIENGEKTTTETTEVTGGAEDAEAAEDEPSLSDRWHEIFSGGAEGKNEAGDTFYFAFDDPDEITYAALLIINADETEVLLYDFGDVAVEDDHLTLYDVGGEQALPFNINVDTEEDDTFELLFQDGDVAAMQIVDEDTIIDDMMEFIS